MVSFLAIRYFPPGLYEGALVPKGYFYEGDGTVRPSYLQVDSQRGFLGIVLCIFARVDSVFVVPLVLPSELGRVLTVQLLRVPAAQHDGESGGG